MHYIWNWKYTVYSYEIKNSKFKILYIISAQTTWLIVLINGQSVKKAYKKNDNVAQQKTNMKPPKFIFSYLVLWFVLSKAEVFGFQFQICCSLSLFLNGVSHDISLLF